MCNSSIISISIGKELKGFRLIIILVVSLFYLNFIRCAKFDQLYVVLYNIKNIRRIYL